MTKREIINWLKEKKLEAKNKVHENYVTIRHNAYDKVYNELEMSEFENYLNEKLREIRKRYDEKFAGRNFIMRDYSGFNLKLEGMINYLHESIERDLNDTIRYSTLKSNENKFLNEVENNYNALIYNVQRMSTAKVAIEYLKSLGIELPKEASTEEQVTAVAKIVDTRFLFLNADKEENNAENN